MTAVENDGLTVVLSASRQWLSAAPARRSRAGAARALRAMRALFTPLLPDDYLELINPLWSTQELRGRIERIERETADAVTVVIKPGLGVAGPRARASTCGSAWSSTASTTGAPTR